MDRHGRGEGSIVGWSTKKGHDDQVEVAVRGRARARARGAVVLWCCERDEASERALRVRCRSRFLAKT